MYDLDDNLVDRRYKMDHETEDMIYTSDLRNEMVVLLGDFGMRNDNGTTYADETNRWCIVTRIRKDENRAGYTVFIGTYADGTKAHRYFAENVPWLVKKGTGPNHQDLLVSKLEILEIIGRTMDNKRFWRPQKNRLSVYEAADEIMELLA